MKGFLTILFAAILSNIAAPYPQTLNEVLPELEIDFSWSTESLRKGKSPFIAFSKIPSGTTYLKLTFTNLQLTGIRQRGSIIRYTGRNSLEEGSLEDLNLPPVFRDKEGLTEYRLTITALNANRRPIAEGSCTKTVRANKPSYHRTLTSDEIIVR